MLRRTVSILLIAATMAFAGCTVGTIETGNVGVVTRWGTVDMKTEPAGFYFKTFAHVDKATTKEVEIQLNDMTPKAKDNLSLQDLDVSIYYTTVGERIPTFVVNKQGQSGWDQDAHVILPGHHLLRTLARGVIYDQVSKYDSLVLHTKRDDVERAVKLAVQTDIDADPIAKGTFTVTRVVIRAIATDKSIENAIRDNVNKDKELEAKTKEVKIAQQEAYRMKVLSEQGGAGFVALLNAQANMKVAEGIAAGKVQTIIVPANFNALGQFK